MKVTVELDLNEPQVATMCEMAKRYQHGWHTADLHVRKDGRNAIYQADWARDVIRAVAEAQKGDITLEEGDVHGKSG